MLHDAKAGHAETLLQLGQRLSVLLTQHVQQLPACGIAQSLEDCIHELYR